MTKTSNIPAELHVPVSPAVLSLLQHGPVFPLIPINKATRSKRLALRIYA